MATSCQQFHVTWGGQLRASWRLHLIFSPPQIPVAGSVTCCTVLFKISRLPHSKISFNPRCIYRYGFVKMASYPGADVSLAWSGHEPINTSKPYLAHLLLQKYCSHFSSWGRSLVVRNFCTFTCLRVSCLTVFEKFLKSFNNGVYWQMFVLHIWNRGQSYVD